MISATGKKLGWAVLGDGAVQVFSFMQGRLLEKLLFVPRHPVSHQWAHLTRVLQSVGPSLIAAASLAGRRGGGSDSPAQSWKPTLSPPSEPALCPASTTLLKNRKRNSPFSFSSNAQGKLSLS